MTRAELIAAAEVELESARKAYPAPNPNTLALAEEAGEAVRASFDAYAKKHDARALVKELVQTIAMCFRLAEEGDPTIGVGPVVTRPAVVPVVVVLGRCRGCSWPHVREESCVDWTVDTQTPPEPEECASVSDDGVCGVHEPGTPDCVNAAGPGTPCKCDSARVTCDACSEPHGPCSLCKNPRPYVESAE
jgi:hypothetical protein